MSQIQTTPPTGGFTPCGACCTRIVNLSVNYGNHLALDDINLHIHCGQLTAIIGPNGAGKTTFLKALLDQVSHTGHISFTPSHKLSSHELQIGYVPQKLDFDISTPMSVLDLFGSALSNNPIFFSLSQKVRQETRSALEAVDAVHLEKRRLGDLSGGELQRVLLALALLPLPDILLLDEPVASIDSQGTELFYNIVSSLRKRFDLAILFVSHDLDLVPRVADQVILLNQKILQIGDPETVLNHPQTRTCLHLPSSGALVK